MQTETQKTMEVVVTVTGATYRASDGLMSLAVCETAAGKPVRSVAAPDDAATRGPRRLAVVMVSGEVRRTWY